MSGLVTVRRHAPGAAPGDAGPAGAAGVTVTLRWGVRRVALTAVPGAPGPLATAPGRPAVVDEHVAVDTDTCPDAHAAACADVLTGSRVRTPDEARGWLAAALLRYPGAALAAVPLADGGWAAAGAAHPGVLVLGAPPLGPAAGAGRHPLVPSCLHACLVLVPEATLRGIADAAVTVAACAAAPAPPRPCPAAHSRARPLPRSPGAQAPRPWRPAAGRRPPGW
jgi:hypothetical protein